MKKIMTLDGKEVKLRVGDIRSITATAFAKGTMGEEMQFAYQFQKDAWLRGEREDARLREEIKGGLR